MPVGAVEPEEEPPWVPRADALGALEWWPLPDNVVMMGWVARAGLSERLEELADFFFDFGGGISGDGDVVGRYVGVGRAAVVIIIVVVVVAASVAVAGASWNEVTRASRYS